MWCSVSFDDMLGPMHDLFARLHRPVVVYETKLLGLQSKTVMKAKSYYSLSASLSMLLCDLSIDTNRICQSPRRISHRRLSFEE